MDNIIKIPSNQSVFDTGANSTTNGLVDFVLPAGAVYDLSNSFVNINISQDTTNDANADGVYNMFTTMDIGDGAGGADANSANGVSNAVVIKNAHARGSKVGVLESIRHVDTLRNTLAGYKKNRAEINDDVNKLSTLILNVS